LVSETIASRDNDDRNYREKGNLLEPFHDNEAITRRETEIEENQIWPVLPRLCHSGERIGGKEGLVLICFEAQVHAEAYICIVIHNQDFLAIHF
jgi:hypothetical protein